MSNATMTADASGGYHLSDDAKEKMYDRMQKADEGDVNRQITGIQILRMCGAALGVVFLIVNAYQGTWALMTLSGEASSGAGIYGENGSLTKDQWAIGATAFGLILGAQVIAVRMAMTTGWMKFFGWVILAGLMSFSVLTSAMHIAFNVEGGVQESIRSSEEYQMAKKRVEDASESKRRAEQSWSVYQEDMRGGDPWSLNSTHSQGPARPYVQGIDSAASDLQAAQRAFDKAKEEGGGSSLATVVGTVAGWFGLDTADFAFRFSIFSVILMEAVRIYLSFLTGRYLMEAMADMARKRKAKEGDDTGEVVEVEDVPAPTPVSRAKVMASSATQETDTIQGPVLRDPIEVEEPRPMFAPRKPRPSAPEDRTPDNKRQANYSKKLARIKDALGKGDIPAGSAISFDRVEKLVGGSRKTGAALRNDLAAAGVAHWKGTRLIAGTA